MSESQKRQIVSSIISYTDEYEHPVWRVELGESKADIIVDTDDDCLNVWDINSTQKGDMKEIMDYAVKKTGYDWVQFIAPLDKQEKALADKLMRKVGVAEDKTFANDEQDRNIRQVLDGFQEVVEEHEGKEIPMLVGFWNID